jgi:hypothetical protein
VAHPASYSMGTGVLPSLPPCSPAVYGVAPLPSLHEFMAWTEKPLPFLGKHYHIHLNKVATKPYSEPTCIYPASYMMQYLQTNIIITCFLYPSASTQRNKRSNINSFIAHATCFGSYPRPSSGDTAI